MAFLSIAKDKTLASTGEIPDTFKLLVGETNFTGAGYTWARKMVATP